MHELEGLGSEVSGRASRPMDDHSLGQALDAEERAASRRPSAKSWRCALDQVIETQIIPRLLSAHGAKRPTTAVPRARRLAIDIDGFARLLLSADSDAARALVMGLRDEGATSEAISLQILAPAARRLGTMWDQDDCDFVDVTVGLGRLQLLLRELRPHPEEANRGGSPSPSVLLSLAPGEVHGFGLEIVANLFDEAGWRVLRGKADRVSHDLAAEHFDVLGYSISSIGNVEPLRNAVALARQASRNRGVLVIAGGALFTASADWSKTMGVDGAAEDAVKAVQLAKHLLERRGSL